MQKHYNKHELTEIFNLFEEELTKLGLSVEGAIDHLFQFSDVVRPTLKLKQPKKQLHVELTLEETPDRYILRQYNNSTLDHVSIQLKDELDTLIRPTVIHQGVETKGVMRTRIPYKGKNIYFRLEDYNQLSNHQFQQVIEDKVESNTTNTEIYVKDLFN